MAMKVKEVGYRGPAKQILAIPDHYVALAFQHNKAVSGTTGLAVLESGRYIVKAGTIYPSNTSAAIGVILNDYDVTDGDAMMAVVVHGFIKVAALPEVPTSAAIAALNQITFNPLLATGFSLQATPAAITVGATSNPADVTVSIAGTTFRNDETSIETLANWTITGEATTKISVDAITFVDVNTVKVSMTQDEAAVAGEVKITPAPSLITLGKSPAAVTIAKVSA